MGNTYNGGTTKGPMMKQKEADEFVATTNFTAPEVKALNFHFSQLASAAASGQSLISRSDFQSAVGMKSSTFVDRLFAVFDHNGDGAINFKEFLTILSVLSTKATASEKLEISFKIYDMDGDGKISRDELTAMLRATADEHQLVLDNAQLASVIDATFQELPSAAGQFIDLQAYSSLVETHPMMLSQFTLNISSLIAEQTAARQGAA